MSQKTKRRYKSPESLSEVQALVIDMDGVLWRGETPLPGLNGFFSLLRRHEIPFRLATNNPTKTLEQYSRRLASMGVEVSPEEVLTSGVVTAQHLAATTPRALVYCIGEDGLRQVLRDHGLQLSPGGEADVVVVGMDRKLSYDKLTEAALLIRGGAQFVGCNPDLTFPSERGIAPGNGASLAYLQASTDVAPVIIGKPEPEIFNVALEQMNTPPSRTATLGDRLETDILGGQNAGLLSILVLSGVTDNDLLEISPIQPDWVFDSIVDLSSAWQVILE